MTKLCMAACIAIMFSPAAFAADAKGDQEPTAQQVRMKECNQKAGDKKGDERKAFMKTCLSAKKETQQSKMASCNKEAGEKKGDERKKFMSECLKAK